MYGHRCQVNNIVYLLCNGWIKQITKTSQTHPHLRKHTHTHTYMWGVERVKGHARIHIKYPYRYSSWGSLENLCTWVFKHLFFHNETLRLENCPLMNYARQNSYTNILEIWIFEHTHHSLRLQSRPKGFGDGASGSAASRMWNTLSGSLTYYKSVGAFKKASRHIC